jgi:plastocyanin
MRRMATLVPLAALVAVLPAPAGAEPAAPSAHAKRCGVIAKGSRDYRVRARVVRCRFAVRWSRAFLHRGGKPRGYSCSRPSDAIPLYCRKGRRVYWAERLGYAARAAHPGHGPGEVLVGLGRFRPGSITVATDDTVLWFWDGPDLNHTVTADPGQAESFDSDPTGVPLHPAGDVYSHRFTRQGSFTYFCRVHPDTMRGTVEVVEPPPVDRIRPRLSRVRANGATRRLKFTTSEPATVLARVERRRGGRWRMSLDFDVAADRGRNRVRMPVAGLREGSYRVALVAYDGADNSSRRAVARFRIRG